MLRSIITSLLALFLCCGAMSLAASTKYVDSSLYMHHQSNDPGKKRILAGIHLAIAPGWHAYWKNPGGIGYPPAIKWNLPEGFTAHPLQWPAPEQFSSPLGTSFGYTGELWLMAEISPPSSWDGSPVEVKAQVNWLICSETTCLPGEKEVSFILQKGENSALATKLEEAQKKIPKEIESLSHQKVDGGVLLHLPESQQAYFYPEEHEVIAYEQHFAHDSLTLRWHDQSSPPVALLGTLVVVDSAGNEQSWNVNVPLASKVDTNFARQLIFALGLAFLGGMILNLMPCVLPVISLKIFSFCKMAKENRKVIFRHGIFFSLGVLISFWILAGVLILLQTYGEAVGWGFQLQEPIFVALLAAVIFVFGLSLFGVLEMGTIFASWAGQKQSDKMQKSNGYWGSFFSGILATAVATPCTGPFLGSAVGFALTLPPHWSLMIFTSLGLGMSSPYLLLAAFPSLLKFVPKPGEWMIVFKEVLGFCMMATTLWLAWVFEALTDSASLFMLMAAFLSLSFGAWVVGKWVNPHQRKKVRIRGLVVGCLLFIGGIYILVKASTAIVPISDGGEVALVERNKEGHHLQDGAWEDYSERRIEELKKEGVPIFIDFTAKWCLICQTNHLVLSDNEVEKRFKELGVVKMKADWTRRDVVITVALKKYERNSVPLYVYYDAQGKMTILPQILTSDNILETLK